MSGAAAPERVSTSAVGAHDRPRSDPGPEPGNGGKQGPNQRGPNQRGPWRGILITIVGSLVTAAIATAVVSPGLVGPGPAGNEEPTLSALAPAEIAAALPTLDPATSKAAVDDAKTCKAPLATVILVQRPGGSGGMVRIRSGAYLSPPIALTNTPQRVAVPYPSPYPAGRGVLSLVGDANEVWLYLRPGWFLPTLKGAASINVHWTVGNPCG